MPAILADRTQLSRLLAQTPSLSETKLLLNRCSAVVRDLLAACEWRLAIATDAGGVPVLAIACPDTDTTWQALHHLEGLVAAVRPLSTQARIYIYPPECIGDAFTTDLADPWGYEVSPWEAEQDF